MKHKRSTRFFSLMLSAALGLSVFPAWAMAEQSLSEPAAAVQQGPAEQMELPQETPPPQETPSPVLEEAQPQASGEVPQGDEAVLAAPDTEGSAAPFVPEQAAALLPAERLDKEPAETPTPAEPTAESPEPLPTNEAAVSEPQKTEAIVFEQALAGLTVRAEAPAGTFPQGTVMQVELLGEAHEAAAALQAGGVEYDGFLAVDIGFADPEGQPLEPGENAVAVSLALAAELLPEVQDGDTLAVQHLTPEGGVETVAQGDAVQLQAEHGLTADFTVNSFSTFTITWSGILSRYFSITAHFVNTEGQEIDASRQNVALSSGTTLMLGDLAPQVSGLAYRESRLQSREGAVIDRITARTEGSTRRMLDFKNGDTVAETMERSYSGTVEADIFLIYEAESVSPPVQTERTLSRTKTAELQPDGTYDLNLTVSGAVGTATHREKLDILLIVDRSNSMKEAMGSTTRKGAVDEAVRQLTQAITRNDENVDARYSVIAFSGPNSTHTDGTVNDAATVLTWTTGDTAANGTAAAGAVEAITLSGATNYQAALRRAKEQLRAAGSRSDARKIVVFLTDGIPTVRIGGGNGSSDPYGYNINSAQAEIAGLSCHAFYAIGAGNDFVDSSSTAYRNLQRLCDSAGTGTGAAVPEIKRVYSAAGTAELNEAFAGIAAESTFLLCSGVTVTDVLSENVEPVLAGGSPAKLTVKAVRADGTVLGGTGTELLLPATEQNEAARINAVLENGQLKMLFPAGYKLEAGWTYQVTLNVQATEAAYENYRNAGCAYLHRGDAGTGTHAGEYGMRSNTEAWVDYTYNGTARRAEYDHPVIRLHPGSLTVVKKVTGLEQDAPARERLAQNLTFEVTAGAQRRSLALTAFEWDEETGCYLYVLEGLSPGAAYSVTEQGETLPGYTLETTLQDTQGTIEADGSHRAFLGNHYQGYGTLVIEKDLTAWNPSMGQDAVFLFRITGLSGLAEGRVYYRWISFTASGEGEARLDGLPVGEYRVEELPTAGYRPQGDRSCTLQVTAAAQARAQFTNSPTENRIPGDMSLQQNDFRYENGGWVFTRHDP